MATLAEVKQDITKSLEEKGIKDTFLFKFMSYYDDSARAEQGTNYKGEPKPKTVSSQSIEVLSGIVNKFANLGLPVDGVNVVITGRNMAMVTANGYKNKVLEIYPESEFDIQIVRESDTFKFSKKNGKVTYSHEFGDPFSNKKIVGAYAVIKNKRGEFLELLNEDDYKEMQSASKQSKLWDKWASEFWFKSVVKRACKRHFNDITADIDKIDNEDFGLSDEYIKDITKWSPSEDEPISTQQAEILDNQFRQRSILTDDDKKDFVFTNYGFDYDRITEAQAYFIINDFQADYKDMQKTNGLDDK